MSGRRPVVKGWLRLCERFVDEPPDARFSRRPGDPRWGFDVNGMEGL